MVGKNLDGDLATEASIAGAIHLTHTARTKRGLNFIGAKLAA